MPDTALTAWQREQAYLVQERIRHPEQFFVANTLAADRLAYIGVTEQRPQLPVGFIKFSPFDFVVEEMLPNNTLASVALAAPTTNANDLPKSNIYEAILVKAGLFSTVDAVQAIAKALDIPATNIRYAGVKDANALTAQRVTIAGVPAKKLADLHILSTRLQHIQPAKEHVRVGQLVGNRFTIVVRTQQPADQSALEARMQTLAVEGFLNFYGEQRFDMPRLHTMQCGRLLLGGKFDEALHLFLTGTTPFEQPFVTQLRTQADACYGDWQQMHNVFARLPYTLRNELSMLAVLVANPQAALVDVFKAAAVCVRYWAMAYGSYLTNLLLSRNQQLPDTLGLLLNKNAQGDSTYAEFLRNDGTADYRKHIAALPFVQLSDNPTIATRITPTFHGVHVAPHAVTISFDLPKGAYATTCLYNLFDLQSVPGIPEWIDRRDINSKQLLGTGDLAPVFKHFDSAREETIQRNIFFTRESS